MTDVDQSFNMKLPGLAELDKLSISDRNSQFPSQESAFEQGEVLGITARARIHCALLNTSGLFGRVDGGIGFSVDDPRWEIQVGYRVSSDGSRLPKEIAAAVDNAIGKFQSLWNIPPLEVRVTNVIDAHTASGFGGRTFAYGREAH